MKDLLERDHIGVDLGEERARGVHGGDPRQTVAVVVVGIARFELGEPVGVILGPTGRHRPC